MAQRFKAADLKEMIRTIVRQEIKEVVAQTVNEILAERYLRQLAENVAAVARPRGVASLEQMGDDAIEEPPPHPLANSREWPFEKHPSKHDDSIDDPNNDDKDYDVDYRKKGDDPMSIFFEGTKPLSEIESNAPSEDDLASTVGPAPLPKNLNEQKRVWTTLAGVKDVKKPTIDADEKVRFEEARLKRMREQLEVKA
jgi:hypothetical protein